MVLEYNGMQHKLFTPMEDANKFIAREAIAMGGLEPSPYRVNCQFLAMDNVGHNVFTDTCYGEVFYTNYYG